jgi:hypothetical protein
VFRALQGPNNTSKKETGRFGIGRWRRPAKKKPTPASSSREASSPPSTAYPPHLYYNKSMTPPEGNDKESYIDYKLSHPELVDELHRWLCVPSALDIDVDKQTKQNWRHTCEALRSYPRVVTFQLFSPEFCELLVEEAHELESKFGKIDPRFGLNITGQNLFYVKGFREKFAKELVEYLSPLAWQLFPSYMLPSPQHRRSHNDTSDDTTPGQPGTTPLLEIVHMYIIKYSTKMEEAELAHPLHVDDSMLTLNICLGEPGFRGGRLHFIDPITGQTALFVQHCIGQAVWHWGDLPHETDEVTEGERLNLLIWFKRPVEENGFVYFTRLIDELQCHVLSFLSPKDLLQALQVSRHFRHLIEDEPLLWRRHIPLAPLAEEFQTATSTTSSASSSSCVSCKVDIGGEGGASSSGEASDTLVEVSGSNSSNESDSDSGNVSGRATWRQQYCNYLRTKKGPVEEEQTRCRRVIEEIISTERSYATALRTCVEVYLKPLQNREDDVLPADLRRSIFSNLETLSAVHWDISKKMQLFKEVCQLCPEQRGKELDHLVSTFGCLLPYLTLTMSYIVNYDNAVRTHTQALEKYPSFRFFEREIRIREATKGAKTESLDSYLITPVRRIPRYSLLLTDLLRYCPADDENNRSKLQQLLLRLQDMGDKINRTVREREQQGKSE